ncbi:hypothetical protein CYLTODRAFT_426202 [Cylindrobasidium torrendii FP15055 ss-10]|uniref:BTB domain-containing protein n=1 Tax=Cylindrobasidium torrendii FP15055 ss-10 TaxID=1314674 RepID=A0A0D7B1E1_9AGAR|nr:hypothetical protein CYLTODRAFT_426202 [Cylindrobasidium torrendii FP15055 ss-10]
MGHTCRIVEPIEEVSEDGSTYTSTFYVEFDTICDTEQGDSVAIAQSDMGWTFKLVRKPSELYSDEEFVAAMNKKDMRPRGLLHLSMEFSPLFMFMIKAGHCIESIAASVISARTYLIRESKLHLFPTIPASRTLSLVEDELLLRYSTAEEAAVEGPQFFGLLFKIAIKLCQPRAAAIPPVLALVKDSFVDSGNVADTKILCHSHRLRLGEPHTPRSFFCHSGILRRNGLNQFCTENRLEEAEKLRFHPTELGEALDYESDSDLEEEDDLETAKNNSDVEAGRSPSVASQDLMDISTFDADAQTLHEIDSETQSQQSDSANMRVVSLRSTAARTWSAFQNYAYFGDITFAKLKSSYTDHEESIARFKEETCSPKSMYRLADQFGLEILKAKALESIKSQLSVDNIVHEAFSIFSSRYPEILDIEVEYLLDNYSKNKAIRIAVSDMMDRGGEAHIQAVMKRVLLGIADR